MNLTPSFVKLFLYNKTEFNYVSYTYYHNYIFLCFLAAVSILFYLHFSLTVFLEYFKCSVLSILFYFVNTSNVSIAIVSSYSKFLVTLLCLNTLLVSIY